MTTGVKIELSDNAVKFINLACFLGDQIKYNTVVTLPQPEIEMKIQNG